MRYNDAMSQSLLLTIARQSIVEVLEAVRSIDVMDLKKRHPVLNEKMATAVTLYLDDEIRSHYCSLHPEQSLIDDLIQNAKIAAFESTIYPPITTSEYLHVSLQVSILTPLKILEYSTTHELVSQITPHHDGIVMRYEDNESYLFVDAWPSDMSTASVLQDLCNALNCDPSLKDKPQVAIFQIQNAKDEAILKS
jgi:AMMECR1 domain-containing protein